MSQRLGISSLQSLEKFAEEYGGFSEPRKAELVVLHESSLRNLPELRQSSLVELQLEGVKSELVVGWEASGRQYFALAEEPQ